MLVVVDVDDAKNVGSHVAMVLLVVVVVEHIGEERLGLESIVNSVVVLVVPVEKDPDVLFSLVTSLLLPTFEPPLVFVKDIGGEEVGQEVESR